MQCNGSCCCCCSPVCCFPRGRRLAGAEEEGEGATWSMPLRDVHCPHLLLLAVQQKKKNNIVFVASVSFFPRFVVALNRFSAIQNYSRMKIKNMFFGKFNTRVDSARQQATFIVIHSVIHSLHSLAHSLTTLLFIYSQQIAYKSFVKRQFPLLLCPVVVVVGFEN